MKINSLKSTLLPLALASLLTACSTTGHHGGGADGDMSGDGMGGSANAHGSGDGAYSQGLGGNAAGGFQPGVSCNVPQSGGQVSSYYFDYDKSDIHSEDMSRLQSQASRHGKLHVVGNTDNRGSREYNIALGWRRAHSIETALEQAGMNKQQINTNSNGAERPIAFGSSESDYQCNRRVDVTEK